MSRLARLAGVEENTFRTWLYQKRRPSRSSVEQVAIALGLDLDETLLTAGYEPIDAAAGRTAGYERPAIEPVRPAMSTGIRRIPVVGAAHAGDGEAVLEVPEAWAFGRQLVALHIEGDCMEPAISSRDMVVVDTSEIAPRNGQMVAAVIPGEGVQVRMYRADPPGLVDAKGSELHAGHAIIYGTVRMVIKRR